MAKKLSEHRMKRIILGTDWWTDCDDAVAMRLIARAVKRGEVDLRGIVINACMENSVASLKGFLSAEGITGIPIGLDAEANDFGGNPPYQKRLYEQFCPGGSNSEADDAVRLYRKLLAAATEPIEIVEIGYLQAVVALLESGGDDISPLSGEALVREKVSRFWVMAGKWDKDGEKENNFCRNQRSRTAGHRFCRLCPVPVTFLGWEVGCDVITGNELAHDDFLYQVLADHGSAEGRSSWDPMLVLLALIGDEAAAGYKVVCGRAMVDEETGANYFVEDSQGLHRYVVKAREDAYYQEEINRLIQ